MMAHDKDTNFVFGNDVNNRIREYAQRIRSMAVFSRRYDFRVGNQISGCAIELFKKAAGDYTACLLEVVALAFSRSPLRWDEARNSLIEPRT